MEYQKDMFKKYLQEAINLANGREIVILGCRGSGAVTYNALLTLGIDVPYFVDIYTDGKTKLFFGKHVYSLIFLKEQLNNSFFVINVFPYFEIMDRKLHDIGLVEGKDYSNLHGYFKSVFCDKYDPFLGFTRIDDIPGFKIYGEDKKNVLRIVTLGGSTTDHSYSNIKSWPKILHEILQKEGIDNVVYNGGICGYMSSQERDKFLRDVIELNPDYTFCLSGFNDIAWNHCNRDYSYYAGYIINQIIGENFGRPNDENELSFGINEKIEDYQNWYKNQKIMHGVAEEFGIKFYSFLQPCMFTGQYKKSEFEVAWFNRLIDSGLDEHKAVKRLYERWNDFYEGAKQCMLRDDHFIDLTGAFDCLTGIFIDGIHCEREGNNVLARQVRKVIHG